MSENELSAAMRTLDMAVLMGGPRFRPQLDTPIRNLTQLLRGGDPDPGCDRNKKEEGRESVGKRKRCTDEEWGGGVVLPRGAFASLKIERILLPTLEDFLCDVLLPAVPTILAGAMEHWAARDRWRNRTYLKKVGGARTVPVEVRRRGRAEFLQPIIYLLSVISYLLFATSPLLLFVGRE